MTNGNLLTNGELTFDEIASPTQKGDGAMVILVDQNQLHNNNIISNNNFTNTQLTISLPNNSNSNLDPTILLMQNEIKKFSKNFELVKKTDNIIQKLQTDVETLQARVKFLEGNSDFNKSLQEIVTINRDTNGSILKEMRENTKENNQLLENIKTNSEINNKLLEDIKKNTNIKNELTKKVKELKQKCTAYNSERLQNCKIGNTPNSIVQVQRNGKICPDIIFIRGMIIAWCGDSRYVPNGWGICNGENGTPDLRNRFIIGASEEIPFGMYGGRPNIVIDKSNLPPLGNGNFSACSRLGCYHHSTNGIIKFLGSYSTYIRRTDNGDSWGSNWQIDLNTGMNSSPINIMNPYLALYFIMKL